MHKHIIVDFLLKIYNGTRLCLSFYSKKMVRVKFECIFDGVGVGGGPWGILVTVIDYIG